MDDIMSTILVIVLLISFFMIYLMYVRIRQLREELNELRDRVSITGEELMRLSNDIEDFKKIKI
ncbi:MAG: hypothetical protein O8C66_01250 [Candidatus Methanoperedens sp.]|nr:hypothetical protein [Candidatus Methanoperedens sp.]MCZ7369114.1 hypothetical protein [Candidatus Methanoperedens sp.]